jgi:hypothetical protein
LKSVEVVIDRVTEAWIPHEQDEVLNEKCFGFVHEFEAACWPGLSYLFSGRPDCSRVVTGRC